MENLFRRVSIFVQDRTPQVEISTSWIRKRDPEAGIATEYQENNVRHELSRVDREEEGHRSGSEPGGQEDIDEYL